MKDRFLHITREELCPQEHLCAVSQQNHALCIGLPKESCEKEKRFVLTPEAVALLVNAGHRVIMEASAGIGINYSDLLYAEAGAEVTEQRAEVFLADIVLKVSPLTAEEAGMLKPGSTIISLLQPQYQNTEVLQLLMQKRAIAIAFDKIKNDTGECSFADCLDEVDGRAAVIVAAGLLTNLYGGKGILMGGIPGVFPAEVVVIGAGLSGRAAICAARGLGALVKLFDENISRLRMALDTCGQPLFTSNLHPNVLTNAFRSADVVIGTSCDMTHRLSEQLIRQMKKGALLIDLCIDKGGCFETSLCPNKPKDSIFEKYGVLHYCLSSVGSAVARTASMALSNLLVPILLEIGECQGVENMIKRERGFRDAVYLFNTKIVNSDIAHRFNLPYCDISLFINMF